MSIAEELAANVVQTRFESLDEETVERAKWRIIDALGCLMVGANAAGCRELVELIRKWGGAEESTILVHNVKGPAYNVALANSVMIRSFDFEPIEAEGELKSTPAHISGTTVSTALTMAEREAASGKELLTALVIGDDLAARTSVASGFDLTLGWDNTGTVNAFGATAIASKLLKLSGKQVLNALGIVMNQLGGTTALCWDAVMAFKLPIALSARNGIFSAELAAAGFTGLKDPFLGRHGFFSLYCKDYNAEVLNRDLGKRFYADRVHKPYSSCRATHSSIDSALKVASGNKFKLEDIARIVMHVAPGTADGFTGQLFDPGETGQIAGAFSIRFTVATALLRGGIKPAYFTDECIRDPRLRSLIDKIELAPTIPRETSSATRIEVQMNDGTVHTAETTFPKGDIYKTPLSREEIKTKYRENVAYGGAVSVENGEKVLKLIESLEDVGDVRQITALMV
jgi:2-methylcitrate dehydratase PrpD